MNKPPVKPLRIDDTKESEDRARELLRQRLVEMIRRNEEIRRDKPR